MLFFQEVAHSTIDTLRKYKTYTNVGTAGRVTAMVTRNDITVTNITRIPSGRGIAQNIEAYVWSTFMPVRNSQATGEKSFCNSELPYLLRASPSNMIVEGHFNLYLIRQIALGISTIVRRSTD